MELYSADCSYRFYTIRVLIWRRAEISVHPLITVL